MSQYYVQPTLRDTEVEPKYTFAEIKWGKIVAIHKHWVPLDEFYRYFEANAFFIDITGVLIDGEEPAIGDAITNDPDEGYKIIHIRTTYTPEEKKQYAIDKLKLTRDKKELEPIEYNEILFDADTVSQTRMEKARTFLEDNNIPSITWTTADNTRVEVGVEDFKGINTLIALRSNELHIRYNRLKWYILSLGNGSDAMEIVDSIDWDFRIPGLDDPEEPEEPENPDTPDNPDNPDNPNSSEESGDPNPSPDPEEPNNQDPPSEPDTPNEPEEPQDSNDPEEPEDPNGNTEPEDNQNGEPENNDGGDQNLETEDPENPDAVGDTDGSSDNETEP